MPWTCRLCFERPFEPTVGDLWFDHRIHGTPRRRELSIQYHMTWGHLRNPMRLRLPNGEDFLLDRRFHQSTPMGWLITGRPPRISATPAIVSKHGVGYFGYLHDGVLGDDEEGRIYR